MILTTAFCPPLSWFAAAAKDFTLSPDRVYSSVVSLEACENYQKQNWRNRCRILTANGIENLSFPIVHDGTKLISEIRVDYSTPWILRMERAIASAYESSAYFEYYRDDFFALLEARPERLWELNLSIIDFLAKAMGLAVEFVPTSSYEKPLPEDFRETIHPKRPNTILQDMALEKPYFQVFARKYGFQSDLSALDLLFNEGPDSIIYLKSAIRK